MKEYLLYGQVQQRLTEHMRETGDPISFFDAVAALWRERQFHTAPELPAVSFEDWDVSDTGAFRSYVDRMPVDLALFYRDLQADHSTRQASRQIPELDVTPMKIAEDQAMGIHEHESFEMLYVMQGRARLFLNGANRDLQLGDLCLVAPSFRHDVVAEEESMVVSITFAGHTIESTLYRLLRGENVMSNFFRASLSRSSRGYLLFHLPPTQQVRLLIRSIFHEGYCRRDYARQICTSYIEILFSYLLRSCALDYERYSEDRDGDRTPALLPIVQYIQANYKTTSLQEIAARFHYEPSYLGKLIKAHLGKNYTEIISELRIAEAKSLLRSTGLSVEKVAEQTGFQSAVHFSRSFRKKTGLSPTQYRKQNGRDEKPVHDRKC